jgi:oxaloacetate decarboxylase gamma subunit
MNIGITLMIVGMITVFAVLVIIIQLSNLLIKIVNRVAPEEDVKPAKVAKVPTGVVPVAPDVAEAISQAIAKITGGKGMVAGIKRL